VRRHEVLEDPRARGRAPSLRAEEVLVRDGDAGERAGLAARDSKVRRTRLREAPFLVERDEGVEGLAELLDAAQEISRHLDAGSYLRRKRFSQLLQRAVMHLLAPRASTVRHCRCF